MKKRILSMLMAMVMVVTMLPTVVLAEDSSQEEHKHCICGSTTCSGEGHNPNQVWAAWDGTGTANVLKSKKYVYLSQTTANSSNNYLNLRANNTDGTNEVEYLCLHGNTWNSNETPYAIQIADGNSLTVTDCSKDGTGKIEYHYNSNYGCVYINKGHFTLINGTIEHNSKCAIYTYSGNSAENQSVTIKGGTLSAPTGIHAESGKVTIDGGTILATKYGTDMYDVATLYFNDGTIDMRNWTDPNSGHGIAGGKVYMKGGTVKGGNIGIRSNANLEIEGGTIENNKTGVKKNTGACYVRGGTFKNNTEDAIQYRNPYSCGYLYMSGNPKFESNIVDINMFHSAKVPFYLENGKTLAIDEDAKIKVAFGSSMPSAGNSTAFTGGGFGDYLDNFVSTQGYPISVNNSGALVVTNNSYPITVASGIANGSVSVSTPSAAAGETVTITATPAEGYEVNTVSYTPAGGSETPVTAVEGVYSFTMPAKAVTVSVTFKAISYSITPAETTNGTFTVKVGDSTPTSEATTATAGATVTITPTPAPGYEVNTITVYKTGEESTTVAVTDGSFTMPAYPVTVAVTFKASAPATYSITLSDEDGSTTGGSYSVDKTTATAGETVTITATPNDGYAVSGVIVNFVDQYGNGDWQYATPGDNNTYTFIMPELEAGKTAKIEVSFVKANLSVTCGEDTFYADNLAKAFEIAEYRAEEGVKVITIKVERDYVEPRAYVSFDNYASVTLDLNGHHVYFEETLWINTLIGPCSDDYQNEVGSIWISQWEEGKLSLTDSSEGKTGFLHAMLEVMYGTLRVDSGKYYGVVFPADTKISGGTFLGMPEAIIANAPDSLYEKWIGSISVFPASVYYPAYEDEVSACAAMEGIVAEGYVATNEVVTSKSPSGYWLAGFPANTSVIKEYTITKQPCAENNYTVGVNSTNGVSYQWYKVDIQEAVMTDENCSDASSWHDNYDAEDGWTAVDDDEYGENCYFKVDMTPDDVLTVTCSSPVAGKLMVMDFDTDDRYTMAREGDTYTYTSTSQETHLLYYVPADGEAAPNVKATLTRVDKVDGQTEAALKTSGLDTGTYACKIAWDYKNTPDNTEDDWVVYSQSVDYVKPVVRPSYRPSANPTYPVVADKSEAVDGTIGLSASNAKKGSTVTVTVTPDKYYGVEKVIVRDESGKEIQVTENADGTYSFKMPSGKVTVEAVYVWENPFVDVKEGTYYIDPVEWALKNDITAGTSKTTFSPNSPCTRAQMVTFLWNSAGRPEPSGDDCAFNDVSKDSYYEKAVRWAYENGITKGTSETTFSPDMECSRAHMATFLCKMADGKAESDTNAFVDVKSNAYYADSVQWAVENGITKGTGNNKYSPDATCTRGQMVTFLYQYYNK